jgi:hypothetical protein
VTLGNSRQQISRQLRRVRRYLKQLLARAVWLFYGSVADAGAGRLVGGAAAGTDAEKSDLDTVADNKALVGVEFATGAGTVGFARGNGAGLVAGGVAGGGGQRAGCGAVGAG